MKNFVFWFEFHWRLSLVTGESLHKRPVTRKKFPFDDVTVEKGVLNAQKQLQEMGDIYFNFIGYICPFVLITYDQLAVHSILIETYGLSKMTNYC